MHQSEWGEEQRWGKKAFPGSMVLGQVSGGCVCVYQLGCLCLSINSVRKVAPLSLVYSFTPLSIYISVCLRVLVSFTG